MLSDGVKWDLCWWISIGPNHYDDAVLPFYKALKVYPAPMELVNIYQKTIPEPVFQTIVSILAIEVKKERMIVMRSQLVS